MCLVKYIVKRRVLHLPLESLSFYRQQMFDVSTASEDAFQIDPATLDINPNVKQSHDAIQLVLPAQSIFLKHLDERKQSMMLMQF